MKKSAIIILLVITVAFAAFVGGFYVGRNYNRATIEISATQSTVPTSLPPTENGTTAATQPTQALLVNINTATLEELMTLPYIGQSKAQAILDYRTEYGPFEKVEDLLNVSGIGEKTLAKFIDYITVGG